MKFTALFAAVLALAATLSSVEASAGGKHKRHHFHGFSYGFVYVAPRHECGYEYWKWKKTGAFYWKKQYYFCKGWW